MNIKMKKSSYKNIDDIILVLPTQEYKEQVIELRKTFLENKEGFDGCAGLEDVKTYEEWLNFDERLSRKYGENFVKSTVYLAIRINDNKLVGIIDFRHELSSEFLLKYGGNIGYSVAIDERRKGYAKKMLNLMLDKCIELRKNKVLLTCDKENIASKKTIIANGGILENTIEDTVGLTKSGIIERYWIQLDNNEN